ncbi:AcrR family transcriptional regulator [Thermocatellispora tengchongensis]|uniref:AcrR family transcriptional regulator n=1 Tax=Thermocatellispora tengchongensis TaxID=1073253 RepID=A0A840PQ80_9ACTN|nr:TetR family transcriptional regulator [Thermocatellispora tengchongensis]MBB5138155.1 AcrR family transcriptional regulator [Thermocatellispora tengchongensis]
MGQPGLRERKKLRTRLALIDAALDLFLAHGYDRTTVEQIADAVEISPRTFFRYFASKEDLALDYLTEVETYVLAALAERPADEPPFTALVNAFRTATRKLAEKAAEDTERYLKIRKVLESTPALMGRAIGRSAQTERRITEVLARRQGTDPEHDRRAQLAVAFVAAATRIGFECHDVGTGMGDLVERVEETLALAEEAIRPDWHICPPPGALS